MAHKKLLDPIHPGEILLEEFMKPLRISINRPQSEIINRQGAMSAKSRRTIGGKQRNS